MSTNFGITYVQTTGPYKHRGDYPTSAVPVENGINSVTGTISDGQTITIAGAGFGTRPDTPLYFNNFRGTSLGDTVEDVGLEKVNSDGKGWPTIADDQSISNGRALKVDYAPGNNGEFFPKVGLTGLSTQRLFTHSYSRFTRYQTEAGEYPIMKRMRAGGGYPYSGYPKFSASDQYSNLEAGLTGDGDRAFQISDGTTDWSNEVWNANRNHDEWARTDHYFNLGDTGVANGEYRNWIKNVANEQVTDYMMRLPGYTGLIEWLITDYDGWSQYGNAAGYYLWVDQMYFDVTLLRIEIGNASTLENCTKRYIQPSTSWSDTRVQVTLNASDLSGQAWVYVIYEDQTQDEGFNYYPGYEVNIV